MDLRPGDIVCERSPGWLGAAVRWFTKGPHEAPTRVNHVGLSMDSDRMIEALWRVRLTRIKPGPNIEVWRNVEMWQSYGVTLAMIAMRYLGRRYGVLKILAHAVDALMTKTLGREVYLARRLCRMDRYPICSWVVAYTYQAMQLPGRYAFGVPPNMASPDDIHDYVTASNEWKMVYQGEALKTLT